MRGGVPHLGGLLGHLCRVNCLGGVMLILKVGGGVMFSWGFIH